MAGKLGGSMQRLVNSLLRPTLPWRSLLARHLCSSARTDYDLLRPSQRREGDAILPSLHAKQVNVLIALDTSGSITEQELAAFITEVNAIKASVNARVTLLACDANLYGPWSYENWEPMKLPKSLPGGGSTDFRPVFEWLSGRAFDLLIYFTDARGQFPAEPPATDTLWLVKGNSEVPWGQRIQLN